MILKRAIQFLKLHEANDSIDVNEYLSLASVSCTWSERLTTSFLKKAVHRNYNGMDPNEEILMNNYYYYQITRD